MNKKKLLVLVLVVSFLVSGSIFADTIYLKSGKVVEGKIEDPHKDFPWRRAAKIILHTGDSHEIYEYISRDSIEKIEKKFKKPEGTALLARQDCWGEEKSGLRTQLIPMSDEYVLGKPMKFSLLMQNVGDSVYWYDKQGIINDRFIVKDPQGKQAYNKHQPYQTCGYDEPIDRGEINILFENRDIAEETVIINSGEYTVQFSETTFRNVILPASNILEIQIKQGKPRREDILITSLVEILPSNQWYYYALEGHKEYISRVMSRKAIDEGVIVVLNHRDYIGKGEPRIVLWQTEKPAKIIRIKNFLDFLKPEKFRNNVYSNEYLGRNTLGHVYARIPSFVDKVWPTFREDVTNALGLSKDENLR
ncbi:hypothetical protein ACFL2W_00600 [Candidatus Omnitrophota bacterium]